MTTLNVAILVGSLRKGSFSRQIAKALANLAPDNLKAGIVEIADLPLYNPDLDEGTPPAAWTAFRDQIRPVDGVLFVTPEYNRSVPGALKNAIDVGSRPYGSSVWSGKPGAVVSCSPGAMGGFGANHHLRQSLVFLDIPTLQQPEMYLGHVDKMLNADGGIASPESEKFLRDFMDKFARWIERNHS
ncbi:MAG: hypothetical protein DI498_06185 [Paracoccus denitrificans]|nr:MAG: hypothetical protein DI498_06185 [Paracoccus denitrificans]PZO85006.1 MAG: hypothetical protein DI633_06185 [Paracoccus denitrificans]